MDSNMSDFSVIKECDRTLIGHGCPLLSTSLQYSGMCYPVCGMVHIKEPLLLINKSSLRGSSGFPFSLSEWSLTICLTPYNHR